jgi:hypothetical protein
VQPSAFESAEAASRCIRLDSPDSYVTDNNAPGGERSLEAGSAGRHVRLSLPQGGSAPQLDMWKLKLNKVRCMMSLARRQRVSTCLSRCAPPSLTLLRARHWATPRERAFYSSFLLKHHGPKPASHRSPPLHWHCSLNMFPYRLAHS